MKFIERLQRHSAENLGAGVSKRQIKDLEARLNILLPDDFREYLRILNYAELFGDPLFGINSELKELDLYARNKNADHFKYGFLAIFANDIDGMIFLRADTGSIYNALFLTPVAGSFGGFVEMILEEA
ncbi:MAG: SMI1/KNR4 family protein [Thiotrichaceae bacterium]